MKIISVSKGLCAKLQRDKSAPMDALNSNTNVEWNDSYDNISDKVEIMVEKKIIRGKEQSRQHKES